MVSGQSLGSLVNGLWSRAMVNGLWLRVCIVPHPSPWSPRWGLTQQSMAPGLRSIVNGSLGSMADSVRLVTLMVPGRAPQVCSVRPQGLGEVRCSQSAMVNGLWSRVSVKVCSVRPPWWLQGLGEVRCGQGLWSGSMVKGYSRDMVKGAMVKGIWSMAMVMALWSRALLNLIAHLHYNQNITIISVYNGIIRTTNDMFNFWICH